MKEIKYKVCGQALEYTMPKEIDHHVAQNVCKELDMLIDAYGVRELVLDFENTEFMDSSGVGIMIGRNKMMQFRNGSVYVKNMGSRVETVFRSAGLYKIIQILEV